MPENYVQPVTNRQQCYTCHKTVTGKKKLSKCSRCHAITYCGKECQVADFARHKWNCIPVMVTEIPGKGRGLVAARDIKMGELIFKEKPSIKLLSHPADPAFMQSLKDQMKNLPEEAKSQFFKLKPLTFDDVSGDSTWRSVYQTVASNTSQIDFKLFNLYVGNSERFYCTINLGPLPKYLLYLNLALVNHSCAPNAAKGSLKLEEEDDCFELRAIRDISKSEEVNTSYFDDVKQFGSIQRKRVAGIRKQLKFDCKCSVCLGKVPCQEKILKKLIDLHTKLDPAPTDWKRDAGIRDKIAGLTLQLYMGTPQEKGRELMNLAVSANFAGDQGLLRKALDNLEQLAEDTKLEMFQRRCDKSVIEYASVD